MGKTNYLREALLSAYQTKITNKQTKKGKKPEKYPKPIQKTRIQNISH